MADNLLAIYPFVLARVAEVQGVASVKEVSELSALLNTGKGRLTAPQDETVFVVFDGFSPISNAANGRLHKVAVGFTLYFVKAFYANTPLELAQVGQVLAGITHKFAGWNPQDANGKVLTATPFKLRNAPSVEYNDGFAMYPISVGCEIVV